MLLPAGSPPPPCPTSCCARRQNAAAPPPRAGWAPRAPGPRPGGSSGPRPLPLDGSSSRKKRQTPSARARHAQCSGARSGAATPAPACARPGAAKTVSWPNGHCRPSRPPHGAALQKKRSWAVLTVSGFHTARMSCSLAATRASTSAMCLSVIFWMSASERF